MRIRMSNIVTEHADTSRRGRRSFTVGVPHGRDLGDCYNEHGEWFCDSALEDLLGLDAPTGYTHGREFKQALEAAFKDVSISPY